MQLSILTPGRKVFEGKVKQVTVMAVDGEIGLLPHHAPLIAALHPAGEVRIDLDRDQAGPDKRFVVQGGILEVHDDGVYILSTEAEKGTEIKIDVVRAELAAIDSEAPTTPADMTDRDRRRTLAHVRLRAACAS